MRVGQDVCILILCSFLNSIRLAQIKRREVWYNLRNVVKGDIFQINVHHPRLSQMIIMIIIVTRVLFWDYYPCQPTPAWQGSSCECSRCWFRSFMCCRWQPFVPRSSVNLPDIRSCKASRWIEPFVRPSAHISLVSTKNIHCNTLVSKSSRMYWICESTPLSACTFMNVDVIDTKTLCASMYNAMGTAYPPYSPCCGHGNFSCANFVQHLWK